MPDLTPLGFHVWGYMKDLVYERPVHTQDNLLLLFDAATHVNDPAVLHTVTGSMLHRFEMYMEGGGHFDHLLN